jgi:uncharacterized membrane protein
MEQLNLLGAWVAQVIFVLCIMTFVAQLRGKPELGRKLGVALLLTAFPLCYLLVQSPRYQRHLWYNIQIGLMLVWLAVVLVVDYVLKLEFRQNRRKVMAYVGLQFAGTGGMIGVASLAGTFWLVSSCVLFSIMAVLAFMQRAKTEM